MVPPNQFFLNFLQPFLSFLGFCFLRLEENMFPGWDLAGPTAPSRRWSAPRPTKAKAEPRRKFGGIFWMEKIRVDFFAMKVGKMKNCLFNKNCRDSFFFVWFFQNSGANLFILFWDKFVLRVMVVMVFGRLWFNHEITGNRIPGFPNDGKNASLDNMARSHGEACEDWNSGTLSWNRKY